MNPAFLLEWSHPSLTAPVTPVIRTVRNLYQKAIYSCDRHLDVSLSLLSASDSWGNFFQRSVDKKSPT